jgi:hypothetical protein
MKVRLNVESDRIIIEKVISLDEFITRMKGFIKKGSDISASDPLFLKLIWK